MDSLRYIRCQEGKGTPHSVPFFLNQVKWNVLQPVL